MEDIKQQNETKTKKRNALNGVWWPYQMFRQFVDAQQEFRFFKRISSFLGRVGGAFRASQHFRDRCLINDANQRYALVFFFRFNVKFRRQIKTEPDACSLAADGSASVCQWDAFQTFHSVAACHRNQSYFLSACKRVEHDCFTYPHHFLVTNDEQKSRDISETRTEADDLR